MMPTGSQQGGECSFPLCYKQLRQLTQNDYSRVRFEKRYQPFPYQTKQKKNPQENRILL